MDTKVNYTLIGAFVLILFSVIVIGIIWLSRGLTVEHYSFYRVYMEESVSGLNVDGAVEYNGVNVGTVSEIKINQRNPRLVELLLSIKDGTPITHATVATLSGRGLTGIVYVALKDSGTDLTPLTADPGQKYPVIKTAPSLFSRLDTGLEKINTSLYKLSTAVQTLLDEENQRSIKQTLMHLDEVTAALAAEGEQFKTLMNNSARASQNLPALVQSGQSAMQSMQVQMNNLGAVSQNLLEITNQIKQNPAVLIRGKAPATLGPGEK